MIGFHLTFDFMHLPGLLGMPRRIYTYEAGRGWEIWNLIATVGVAFQAAGAALSRVEHRPVAPATAGWPATIRGTPGRWSGRRRRRRRSYNFATIPVVKSRRPLWDLKHPDDPDWKYE